MIYSTRHFKCYISSSSLNIQQQRQSSKMGCLTSFYKCICCISDPKFPIPYQFKFGSTQNMLANQQIFESNFVKTSKYSWYDFFPKSLLLQFKRLANIYFLVIGILQSIPAISPLGPFTAWAPLIVVLGISMIRQGFEDYQRYKSDRELNHQLKTHVIRNGVEVQLEWQQVLIGDIVKINNQQLFPVDLILLNSSGQGGNAFIETASLDGQKNLKPRSAYKGTQNVDFSSLNFDFWGKWKGIVPDKQLHNFSSKMYFSDRQKPAQIIEDQYEQLDSIDYYKDKQLLYRGARLKNTKYIYGLAIYTGRNTKIMMNSDSSSDKMSQIEAKVNSILAMILLLQLFLCGILAIFANFFILNNKQKNTYIDWGDNTVGLDSFLLFCSYFVLINTMIPISLIVSIEIVKVSQSYFIDKDKLMYSDFRKKYVNVKSASLNQELGQIEYVFTDKTGTLTMNLMEFKIAVVGSKMYGDLGLIINDPHRPPQKQKGFHDVQLEDLILRNTGVQPVNDVFAKNKEGNQNIKFSNSKQLAEQYLTILALAHEVVGEQDQKTKVIKYMGPSPDEISLVDAAREMSFEFEKTTQNTTQLKIRGESKKFELMEVFPFTSDRKRMAVVVRSGGFIKMYMKGADSIVKGRLAPDNKLNLDEQLLQFSRIGLRTLLIAVRLISDQQYSTFKSSISKLPPENKEEAYDKLVSDLEQNMYLVGATAVLDRLQDEVPETIRDLIKANIKVWMLTGDKMETAENIAKSCNLIQSNFQVLRYEKPPEMSYVEYLKSLGKRADELTQSNISKGLLIEGQQLTPLIGVQECEKQLANLAKYCQAVVCCRLLPIQKAEVVRIVRNHLKKITLSIGDGANDVPMIKTAHIGIGLFGQQGMGAVQASDYALPQFRMLWRLLLVHGRWNYIRISQMILYFFYKNMIFTVPQFIFAFYCGYSGQTVFDDYYIALYNLFFTSLPLVIRAILEQDVNYVQESRSKQNTQLKQIPTHDQQSPSREVRQNSQMTLFKPHVLQSNLTKYIPKNYEMNKYLYKLFPRIYFIGQQNCIFNYSNFFLWVIQAIIQSCLITFITIYILTDVTSMSSGGYNPDLWITSVTAFTAIMFVVTFKLSTHTKFWSVILFVCILFFSLGLYITYMWISNYYFSPAVLYTPYMFFTTGQCMFIVLFSVCVVLAVDGIVLSFDYEKGGYISRMRKIIQSEKQHSRTEYFANSLRNSDINTVQGS